MSLYQRRLPWIFLLGWGFTGSAFAQLNPEADRTIGALARPLVYRVHAAKHRATAVLIDVEQHWNSIFGVFATCFHAMAGAADFSLNAPREGGRRTATVYDSTDRAKPPPDIFPDPDHDLVIIKVPLAHDPGIPRGNYALRLRSRGLEEKDAALQGMAFGYPYYLNDTMVAKPVLFEGVESASRVYNRTAPRLLGTDLKFEFIGLDATAQGMSGGPVFDTRGSFAGLVFGRLPDTVNLMIPASFVLDALNRARKSGGFKPFDPKLLEIDLSPFPKEVITQLAAGVRELTDDLAWDDFSHWTHVFGNLGYFRRSFQEVSIDRAFFEEKEGGELRNLTLAYDKGADHSATKGALDLWVNGRREQLVKGNTFELAPHLRPGENLLILTRSAGGGDFGSGLDLGEMLSSLSIDVQFQGDPEGPNYHLKRSLPTIAQTYSVYVTIHRPWKLDPHDARVAVRLSWLEEMLRSRLLRWSPVLTDARTGSGVTGSALIRPLPSGSITAIRDNLPHDVRDALLSQGMVALRLPERATSDEPSQSLDLTTQGYLKLMSYRVNAYGIQTEGKSGGERPLADIPAVISARLQVISGGSRIPYLCARVIAGYTSKTDQPLELAIPLSDSFKLKLDVSPILHEGLINFLNNNFLKPTDPSSLDAARTSAFLDSTGLNALKGRERFQTHQVFVHDGWLITTFRLRDGGNRLLTDLPSHDRNGVRDPATFLEFTAVGVPPSLAELQALFQAGGLDPFLRELIDVDAPVRLVTVRFSTATARGQAPAAEQETPEVEIKGDGEDVALAYATEVLRRVLASRRHAEVQVDAEFLAAVLSTLVGGVKRADGGRLGGWLRPEKPALTITLDGNEVRCNGTGLSYEPGSLTLHGIRLDGLNVSDLDVKLSTRGPGAIEGRITGRFDIRNVGFAGAHLEGRLTIIPLGGGRQGIRIEYEGLKGDTALVYKGKAYKMKASGGFEVSPSGEIRWDGTRNHDR